MTQAEIWRGRKGKLEKEGSREEEMQCKSSSF